MYTQREMRYQNMNLVSRILKTRTKPTMSPGAPASWRQIEPRAVGSWSPAPTKSKIFRPGSSNMSNKRRSIDNLSMKSSMSEKAYQSSLIPNNNRKLSNVLAINNSR